MCELNSTVLPRSCRLSMMRLTSTRPTGSRPVMGSSSKHQLGVVDQRLGDADALQHALGVLAKVRAGRPPSRPTSPRSASTRSRRVVRVKTEEPAAEAEELAARRGSRRSTGSQAGSRREQRPATPSSTDPDVGPHQPERHLDGGRLAGAVRAQEARTRAPARHLEVDALQNLDGAAPEPHVDGLVHAPGEHAVAGNLRHVACECALGRPRGHASGSQERHHEVAVAQVARPV